MSDTVNDLNKDVPIDDIEIKEWISSLDYMLANESPEKVQYLLQQLKIRAQQSGIQLPFGCAHSASRRYVCLRKIGR